MFKRKVYDALAEWKEKYSKKYAAMLEGARRVGKSTVAEEFAKNNYKSYIKIDFANIEKDVLEVFDDIASLDMFFLRLQTATGITLYPGESVIIFDEIQRAPLVRQAIKYLVAVILPAIIPTTSMFPCWLRNSSVLVLISISPNVV